MRALVVILILVAIGWAVTRGVRWALAWRAERHRARSKWSVETRKAAVRLSDSKVPTLDLSSGSQHAPDSAWAVVLRRPGEEQVYKYVAVGKPEELLQAQADADAEATALNEGRRR